MKLIVSFVLFIVAHISLSQQTDFNSPNLYSHKSISQSLSIQKFDVFSHFHFSMRNEKLNYSAGLGIGLNRTFYQNRFFPELSLGLSYGFVSRNNEKKSSVFFGPEVRLTHAFLRVNELHQFSTLLFGYHFQIGRKLLVIHRAGFGGLLENFKMASGRYIHAATFTYHGSIGIGYAFD
jgi:hypothetical protein